MSADDRLIGKKLGDYTIQGLLGRGGMSRVYRGYDEYLDRYAAVKVISGDFATTNEEEYTRRFQTEARAIAHLRHPNIVGIYQFGRSEGIYYMAQVFLEGQDLRMILQKYAQQGQRMPPGEMIKIVRDVAGALDYAHEQGVIHRDIKPSNIMLEKKTGRAILMDFGLALSVQEGTMGDTFGSAHYIAPEQAVSSKNAVPQSDMYSLGIVIYEMLAGKVPFDDPSVMTVALKHLNELPPPPTMYNPDLPPAVEQVIMRALDKDPKRRYPSGKDMADALETAFLDSKPMPVTRATGPTLTEMMDAPAPPLPAAAEPFTENVEPAPEEAVKSPRPTPAPVVAYAPGRAAVPDDDEVKLGGVAGRFARRRARKEAEAAEGLTEADLQMDADSLDRFLDTLADPSEIGLVGPNATGIVLPEKPAEAITQTEAPPDTLAAPPEKKRRSRLRLLLALLLVIVIAAGAWYMATQGDKNPALTGDQQTGTAAAALAGDIATTEAPSGPTATNTARATRRPPIQPTVDVTDSGVIPDRPTEQPVTRQVSPTVAPSDTATPTSAPSDTPTVAPSDTPTTAPSDTPTRPPTLESGDTPPAILPATEVSAAATPTQQTPPDIRLLYEEEVPGQGAFLLINISNRTQDISQLEFEQTRADGQTLSYEASLWNRADIEGSPSRLAAGGCLQLITNNGTPEIAITAPCAPFLGFYRTFDAQRYFWLSAQPDAVFSVRRNDTGVVLATCEIAAGECTFALSTTPSTVSTGPSPTDTPASEPPNMRLIYNAGSFVMINTSEETLDASRLRFERPGDPVRYFDAAEWDAQRIGDTTALEAQACLQLAWAEVDYQQPSTDDCPRFMGWFSTSARRRYFWQVDRLDASFIVKNGDTVLATCEAATGECTFYLPPQ